jgi:hypothetical protein
LSPFCLAKRRTTAQCPIFARSSDGSKNSNSGFAFVRGETTIDPQGSEGYRRSQMAKKRESVVRVYLTDRQREGAGDVLECLRYAQVLTVHRNDENGVCFDVHAPQGLNSEVWAKQNAERMSTYGWNAVSAPSTRGAA